MGAEAIGGRGQLPTVGSTGSTHMRANPEGATRLRLRRALARAWAATGSGIAVGARGGPLPSGEAHEQEELRARAYTY